MDQVILTSPVHKFPLLNYLNIKSIVHCNKIENANYLDEVLVEVVVMQVLVDLRCTVAVGKTSCSVDVACRVADDIRDRCCDNSCLADDYFVDGYLLDCSIDLVDSHCFGYYFLDCFSMFSCG